MAIGDVSRHRLRGYRDGAGMSLAEVAEGLGCAAAVVGSWEAGTSVPVPAALADLARVLGAAPEAFARRHDDETRDYLSAVVDQMPPLDDDEIQSVAAVWRRIDQRRAFTPPSPIVSKRAHSARIGPDTASFVTPDRGAVVPHGGTSRRIRGN